jgi:hypothetical protein
MTFLAFPPFSLLPGVISKLDRTTAKGIFDSSVLAETGVV